MVTAAFVIVIFVTSALQSVSGFSFALLAVTGATALSVASLWQITFAVTLLLMVNTAYGMHSIGRWPDRAPFLSILLGVLPGTLAGLGLLGLLSDASPGLTDWLLGGVTLVSAGLLSRGSTRVVSSSRSRLVILGALSGLSGGALGAPGPVLVYGLYRQPLKIEEIRLLLFSVFLIYSFFRTLAVLSSGGLDPQGIYLALAGLPAAILGAYFGRRFAVRFVRYQVRRLAVVLLVVSGIIVLVRPFY